MSYEPFEVDDDPEMPDDFEMNVTDKNSTDKSEDVH